MLWCQRHTTYTHIIDELDQMKTTRTTEILNSLYMNTK